jgi:hypothetical protein
MTHWVEVWQPVEGECCATRELWNDTKRGQRRELLISFECPFELFFSNPNSKVVQYDISLGNNPVQTPTFSCGEVQTSVYE